MGRRLLKFPAMLLAGCLKVIFNLLDEGCEKAHEPLD
jgi:hypothetical protein